MTDLYLSEMDHLQLHQLLTAADRDAGPPPLGPPLTVGAARKLLAQRQRRNRVMVGATAVVLLLTAGIVWRATNVEESQIAKNETASPTAPGPIDASTSGQPTPVDPSDIAALVAEAEFHALVARRMIAALEHQKAIEAWEKERALGDPLENIREELDKTAFRMIARADRIIDEMGPRDSAIAIYRDVIRLFPKTLSAGVAHDRLARLDQQGDT